VEDKREFLQEALEFAKRARELGEVPVGCVIAHGNRIIASAHNMTVALKDPTAHAEILALRRAGEVLGDWRLSECSVYVTLEPCVMCAYALVLARVKEVVFGAVDEKHGGVMTLYNILDDPRLNHRVRWVYHPLSECADIIGEFFRKKR
jgi:tRNA(adenine34) deaminase